MVIQDTDTKTCRITMDQREHAYRACSVQGTAMQ